MTLDEYIRNPMSSSVMTNRKVYFDMYSEKWNTIKLRENGLIRYTLYNTGEEYVVHFKIPSEVVPKFYYDTIVRFFLTKGKKEEEKSRMLTNYDVQFFSNDPSFAFTFAHAFNKNNLFIKDLESRMIPKCLKDRAIEKNPKDEVGYVKSLYFAYLEIKDQGLLLKQLWKSKAKPYDKKVWDREVRHTFDVVEERQKLGEQIAAKERREKKREQQKGQAPKPDVVKPFKSPNPPNFGHLHKTNYNETIDNLKPSKQKKKNSFGEFVNKFKKKK